MNKKQIEKHIAQAFKDEPKLIRAVEGIADTKQAKSALKRLIIEDRYIGKSNSIFLEVLRVSGLKVIKGKQ